MGKLLKTPEYLIRLGLSWFWFFFTFGSCCLLLPFRWKDPMLSYLSARMLYWGTRKFLKIKIDIINEERIDANRPCVFVCNHQSNIDILTMCRVYPKNAVLIGKKELFWVPVFGQFFYGSGHILLNRQNRAQSVEALQWVANEIHKRSVSVWIFPEGHRNRGAEKMLDFKKGAFRIAIQAQVPIVPIVHQHLSRYFDPSKKLIGSQKIYMKVLEPIQTKGLTAKDTDSLMTLVRQKMEAAMAEINAMPIEKI